MMEETLVRAKGALAMVAVAGMLQAGSALAALQLRDINGAATNDNALAVMAYDTVLNVTWDLTGNNGPNNNGLNWAAANTWASTLTVGKYTGWMLPSALNADGTGLCSGYNCTSSQMGELYYTELGNVAYPNLGYGLAHTGPFKNLQPNAYWSGTEYPPVPNYAWDFYTISGFQDARYEYSDRYALAVRPGDVAAVPEPGTVGLMMVGLGALVVMRRKRPVGS